MSTVTTTKSSIQSILDMASKAKRRHSRKKFKKLSKREKRIIIAKDVLAQLHTGKYVAETGVYCYPQGIPSDQWTFEVAATAPTCYVCGIGSLMISTFRKFPKDTPGKSAAFGFGHDEVAKNFGKAQAELIESAFEQCDMPHFEASTFLERRQAARFGQQFANDNDRLKGIMENIVANGKFVPTLKEKSK